MRREGFVHIDVCRSILSSYKPSVERKYNRDLLTNQTVKFPYAHCHYGRAACGSCSQPQRAGKFKRKQLKHDLNINQDYMQANLVSFICISQTHCNFVHFRIITVSMTIETIMIGREKKTKKLTEDRRAKL
jgi:hypothetical protein